MDAPLSSFWIFLVTSGLVHVGFLSLIMAFKDGSTGLSISVSNAYGAISVVFSVLVLGAVMSIPQASFVAAILALIFYITYEKTDTNSKNEGSRNKSIIYAMSSMLFYGIGFAMYDYSGRGVHWVTANGLFCLANAIIAITLFALWHPKTSFDQTISTLRDNPIGIPGALFGLGGSAILYAAISSFGSGAVPVAVTSISALITSYFAFVFDHDQLSLKRRVGSVLVVVCLFGLALS